MARLIMLRENIRADSLREVSPTNEPHHRSTRPKVKWWLGRAIFGGRVWQWEGRSATGGFHQRTLLSPIDPPGSQMLVGIIGELDRENCPSISMEADLWDNLSMDKAARSSLNAKSRRII
jgi:hypothetical protein